MTTLSNADIRSLLDPVRVRRSALAGAEQPAARQPVHTVYGGAHLFRSDAAGKLGRLALAAFDDAFADDATLQKALELRADPALVRARVRAKLQAGAVEDLRIDFEDGYGPRPDAEEDGHALAAAHEVARGLRDGSLPPGIGIRVKSLSPETEGRALRTLDLFLTALSQEAGSVPEGFVVTLPKVQLREEVAALVRALELMEARLGLTRRVPVELMLETPRSLIDPDGAVALPSLLRAAEGRCSAVHVGSYDLTASLGVAAEHQALTHPACDFAKHLAQVALAGTGVHLSDGATTVLPIPRHRAGAEPITAGQRAENLAIIHAASQLHARNVRHGLAAGIWQGWDLHPAQIPIRYAVLHDFFLRARDSAAARLSRFLEAAAQATRVGAHFDDAATGQGLLNFFLRGHACGALDDADLAAAGLSPDTLRHRSFVRLLDARRG